MNRSPGVFSAAFLSGLLAIPATVLAQDPLETETARFYRQGTGKVVDTVEFQSSKSGHEVAIPIQIEYGITDRLELLLEPVAYTSIRPEQGLNGTDFGDVEITLSYLLFEESDPWPAFAVAGEVKIPTARDPLVGTMEPDYSLILVASKKIGDFDCHANLGFTFLGQPPGGDLKDSFNFAIAAVWKIGGTFDLVAEVVGSISSTAEGDAVNPVVPESAGQEGTVGLVGGRYYFRPNVVLSFGVGYDDNNSTLTRFGLTLKY